MHVCSLALHSSSTLNKGKNMLEKLLHQMCVLVCHTELFCALCKLQSYLLAEEL